MHNNKKCFYDGYLFDSYAEKNYYIAQKSNNDVSSIIVKPIFILQEGFYDFNNKKIRPITFTPDFLLKFTTEYTEKTGIHFGIIDIKPWNRQKQKFILEQVFILKWKMLQYQILTNNLLAFNTMPDNDHMIIPIDGQCIAFTLIE